MSESTLVRRIIKAVKARCPKVYVAKLSDRFRRGIPDLLILLPHDAIFVETKAKEERS